MIESGCAIPNTGIPGVIAGYGKERVIHLEYVGILHNEKKIGDYVKKDEVIVLIETDTHETYPVHASIIGIIRGLIRDQYPVTRGFKIADIDPRDSEYDNGFTISDKARCIADSVLEVICGFLINSNKNLFWQGDASLATLKRRISPGNERTRSTLF